MFLSMCIIGSTYHRLFLVSTSSLIAVFIIAFALLGTFINPFIMLQGAKETAWWGICVHVLLGVVG